MNDLARLSYLGLKHLSEFMRAMPLVEPTGPWFYEEPVWAIGTGERKTTTVAQHVVEVAAYTQMFYASTRRSTAMLHDRLEIDECDPEIARLLTKQNADRIRLHEAAWLAALYAAEATSSPVDTKQKQNRHERRANLSKKGQRREQRQSTEYHRKHESAELLRANNRAGHEHTRRAHYQPGDPPR